MTAEATRLQQALHDAGVDAAILSGMASVADATGFYPRWEAWPGENPHVLDPTLAVVDAGHADPVLLLPSYYRPYAESATSAVEIVTSSSPTAVVDQAGELARGVADQLGGRRRDRLGYEPRSLPVAVFQALGRQLEVGEWVDVGPALEAARARKTDGEIEGIRRAAAYADLVQAAVRELAVPGIREVDLASACLERCWADAGERFPILLQVKSGPATAARGQWHPGTRRLEPGDVVLTDTAPWFRGFWADSANSIVVGEPDRTAREIFAVVAEALAAALDAIRPGADARQVDAAARDVLRSAGHEFPHHVGHGLGRSRFEGPVLSPASTDVIAAGNVIAVEPVVYLEGRGGFRHEHLVVVRENGPDVLTRFAHTL